MESGLELKFAGGKPVMTEGAVIEGYASRFGLPDQGGDIVAKGAFGASLARLAAKGDKVRMLWQHDPTRPIGVWDEIREDATGLWVKGRLLPEVTLAREAATLIEAGAIDGLSIGYRTIRAAKDQKGHRLLTEVELWEVSLVTFPMLAEAKLGAKSAEDETEIAAALIAATEALRD
ncbi:MAG: HK97 family phage prohead protease [Paracoccus denitrificans]|uniref:HK97 family phage prohead protease n=1 Tax=Paracoccus denitrificans TaxID=266 RepID=A0A533I543_PARDE|nr:MAG: HK97 family phage prohead protease [Paracoccus denitrificans]